MLIEFMAGIPAVLPLMGWVAMETGAGTGRLLTYFTWHILSVSNLWCRGKPRALWWFAQWDFQRSLRPLYLSREVNETIIYWTFGEISIPISTRFGAPVGASYRPRAEGSKISGDVKPHVAGKVRSLLKGLITARLCA